MVYFCSTSLSSRNQVDGLPLVVHTGAVRASSTDWGVSDNRYFLKKVKKNIKFKPYTPNFIFII